MKGREIPLLDAVVSRSKDGSELYLKLVNTHPATAVTTGIEVHGAQVGPDATLHLITADTLKAHNSFATRDAIRPRQETIPAGRSFEVTLPPHSVSVIILRVVGS